MLKLNIIDPVSTPDILTPAVLQFLVKSREFELLIPTSTSRAEF